MINIVFYWKPPSLVCRHDIGRAFAEITSHSTNLKNFLCPPKAYMYIIKSFTNILTLPPCLQLKTRPGVQQCQAQGQVFCPWLGLIKDRTGMFKTNKSKFWAGWIKGIILGTQLLSF